MRLIEKEGKLTNFLTPVASILFILASVQFIAILVAIVVGGFLPEEETLNLLWLNLIIDLLAAVFIVYSVIPLLKMRNIENKPLNIDSTWQTLGLTSLFYTIAISSTIALSYIIDQFYPEEAESSYSAITPTIEQFNSDPMYLIVFVLVLSVAAPIFEELVFRKVLIETLESRGTSSIGAVLLSSIVFASAHTPNDLVNGDLRFAIEHFFPVFFIGVGMGLAYILTRNVIYPMLIHAIFNGISAIGQYAIIVENYVLISIFGIFILILLVAGFIIGIYALIVYLSSSRMTKWKLKLKERSEINIIPGSIGLLGIYLSVMTIETILTTNISDNISTDTFLDLLLKVVLIILIESIILITSLTIILNSKYEGKGKKNIVANKNDLESLDYDKEISDYRNQKSIFCPYCGVNNPSDAVFCKECGSKFEF